MAQTPANDAIVRDKQVLDHGDPALVERRASELLRESNSIEA